MVFQIEEDLRLLMKVNLKLWNYSDWLTLQKKPNMVDSRLW